MKTFADFSLAFDYYREVGKPVTVLVGGEKWHLFPSGHARKGNTTKKKETRKPQ